jgi:hypothetical protein
MGEAFGLSRQGECCAPAQTPSLASEPTSGLAGVMPLEINRAPVLTLWAAVVAERLGRPGGEAAGHIPHNHRAQGFVADAEIVVGEAAAMAGKDAIIGILGGVFRH